MDLTVLFRGIAVTLFTVTATLFPATLQSQTVISNESFVNSTFVVDHGIKTAECRTKSCHAITTMLAPIHVNCPGATGQTCTFHISVDAKVSVVLPCYCGASGPMGFFQFLVDNAAPTVGPTRRNGNYLFENAVWTTSPGSGQFISRQSYTGSVVGTVTNTDSSDHTIALGVGCSDDTDLGGCQINTHSYTMRVDVFQP